MCGLIETRIAGSDSSHLVVFSQDTRGRFPYNDGGRQPTGLSIYGPRDPSPKGSS